MILPESIVNLLLSKVNVGSLVIKMTSDALFFYSIAMINFGFRESLSKIFYSMQNTKIYMINVAIIMFINIILNIVFQNCYA